MQTSVQVPTDAVQHGDSQVDVQTRVQDPNDANIDEQRCVQVPRGASGMVPESGVSTIVDEWTGDLVPEGAVSYIDDGETSEKVTLCTEQEISNDENMTFPPHVDGGASDMPHRGVKIDPPSVKISRKEPSIPTGG